MTHISFHPVREFEGWDAAPGAVRRLLEKHSFRRILEVGSGANPVLDPDYVAARGIEYTVNDISEAELEKSNQTYQRLVLDVSEQPPPPHLLGYYDFIFSRMVNEHVRDGERYFRTIWSMLAPGGITAHWYSTLYSLPFTINWLTPEWLGSGLLRVVAPRDSHRKGKFRAHYSWSRGPTPRMIRRFEGLGFRVLEYRGYFGHYYFQRVSRTLHRFEEAKSAFLTRHPIPKWTSYAHLVLQKPSA